MFRAARLPLSPLRLSSPGCSVESSRSGVGGRFGRRPEPVLGSAVNEERAPVLYDSKRERAKVRLAGSVPPESVPLKREIKPAGRSGTIPRLSDRNKIYCTRTRLDSPTNTQFHILSLPGLRHHICIPTTPQALFLHTRNGTNIINIINIYPPVSSPAPPSSHPSNSSSLLPV